MERRISLSDLKKALEAAYNEYKSLNDGEVDPRLEGTNPDLFGISIALADGTTLNIGDTDAKAPMGALAKIPVCSILLTQNSPEELLKKAGACPKCCKKEAKPIRGSKGVRAVSAIEPVGDFDSKWNLIENRMIDLMGTAPILDDKLYEGMKARIVADNEVNALADADFYLFDDAAGSIDLYRRAQSMTASTAQLAMMGATIAADGINPVTKTPVFEPRVANKVVAMMATKGPHHMALPWNMLVGVPARSGFGGAILAVLPGVLSIAAYSPRLMPNNVSVRAFKAIAHIVNNLGLSIYQSGSTVISK